MSKLKNKKKTKSHLSAEEKITGRRHVYILLGMIMVGIALGLYRIQ